MTPAPRSKLYSFIRKNSTIFITLAFVAAGAGLVAAVMALANTLVNSSPQANYGCSAHSKDHRVVIQNDKLSPAHLSAPKCDTLTIVNQDDEARLMAFGVHDAHMAYDGVTDRVLGRGQSFTVTLVKTGNFRFHDHEHDEVAGTFTVTP